MKNLIIIGMISLFGFSFMACNTNAPVQETKETAVETDQTKAEAPAQQQAAPAETTEAITAGVQGQKVLISTDYGNMTVLLYDGTPKHRDNFIKLIKEGFYNGTLFHRVIKDFMIQGGDPDSKNAKAGQQLGVGGPGYTVEAEFRPEYCHIKGALAAARQGDQMNPERRSSGSQFYIVQGKKITAPELNNMVQSTGATYTADQINAYQTIGGTPFLDNQYTVFGEVIDGLNVIDKIAASKTGAANRPEKDIKMTITLIEK